MAKKKSKQPAQKTSEIQAEPIAAVKKSIDDTAQVLGAQTTKPPEPSLNQVLQNLADAFQNSRSQPEPRKRLSWIGDQLSAFWTILRSVIVIAFTFFFIFFAYREFRRDSVLIEPFEVPEELEKNGYTGRAIANRLIDQIDFIKTTASTSMERKQFISEWSRTQPDVEVPGAAISLGSFLEYIKEFFGNAPLRIVGEVFLKRDSLYVAVRVAGNPSKTISGRLENLDEMLRQASLHIYKYTQPYILASYFYQIDKKASLETIGYILSHDPPDDDARAYNLWGLILKDQLDYDGAITKYQKAIDLDPKSALAYNNWGNVLQAQKDFDGAITKYQKAIDLDPKSALAYNNWGTVLEAQKDYAGAIAKYQKAIELDPKSAVANSNCGDVLEEQKDYVQAIAKYEKAAELDPNGEFGAWARNSINRLKNVTSKE